MSIDPTLRRLAAAVLVPGFDGTTAPPWLLDLLDDGLAGVCLFGQNVADPEQVRALTDSLHAVRPGVLVTSDEEGGTVTRLDVAAGSPWPGHATLGALDDVAVTAEVARGLGARARALGVDVVLGPVADVASEPDNPVIGERSFGADPDLVARHAAAFVRGLHAGGAAACAKHFPGHGATRTDSHLTLPELDVDEATWRRRDLAPFAAAVEAGVDCVMTAHVVVRALDDQPSTTSPRVLGLLRDELGFDGVVMTDAIDMKALSARVGRAGGAAAALRAGVDLVCVGNPVFPERYDDEAAARELVDAIALGVPGERLEEAAARVSALRMPAPGAAPTDAEALALGVRAAGAALSRRGDVGLAPGVPVLLAPSETAYAAGTRPSQLARHLDDVVAVDDPDAALRHVRGREGRPVVAVEGRSGPRSRAVVEAVLAERADTLVVHLGPDDPHAPPATHQLTSHAGGRAAALAVRHALVTDTQEDM
ncbi:glycoside hydrolase family 3 protein [Nocardioides sp. J2M5]|uniref:glycoside hydrolase family 3 protein n=1 Tax=Nocardioides palaemonis TaxID=2829810 RepID=UPI001BAC3AC1|nr:glycoside hydrolase family 3 protein [Nocardioides palaemonis]MBS2938015.1 glycoside hydrolase family 3 protein [Nocardioides palaemonis]